MLSPGDKGLTMKHKIHAPKNDIPFIILERGRYIPDSERHCFTNAEIDKDGYLLENTPWYAQKLNDHYVFGFHTSDNGFHIISNEPLEIFEESINQIFPLKNH